MDLGLALDLSSPAGTFSLFEISGSSSSLIEEFHLPGLMTHSETFLAYLDASLKDKSWDSSLLKVLVTSSGPGSFTGLRIAYSSLKALARVHQLSLVTVEGPEAQAWNYFQQNPDTETDNEVAVLSYLTREKWLATLFKWGSKKLEKLEAFAGTGAFSSQRNLSNVLVDPRISEKTRGDFVEKSLVSSLCSKHLLAYPLLNSAQTFSADSVANLSPQYFGCAHFYFF
jgi:tRNA A37 threonylcarbamoyladenosine modification protein TsaB